MRSVTHDSVDLAWDAPVTDGGLSITGYVIERRNVPHGGWTTVATVDSAQRSFKIKRLLEGNEYNFRVIAENAAGMSKAAETTHPVLIKSPFGKYY